MRAVCRAEPERARDRSCPRRRTVVRGKWKQGTFLRENPLLQQVTESAGFVRGSPAPSRSATCPLLRAPPFPSSRAAPVPVTALGKDTEYGPGTNAGFALTRVSRRLTTASTASLCVDKNTVRYLLFKKLWLSGTFHSRFPPSPAKAEFRLPEGTNQSAVHCIITACIIYN